MNQLASYNCHFLGGKYRIGKFMLFLEKASQNYVAGNGKVLRSLEGHCGLRTNLAKAGRFNLDSTV